MTSTLGPIPSTSARVPLSADFLHTDGHSDNETNTHPKSPNLPSHDIPVLPSSLLPLLLQYLLPPSPAGLPPHLLSHALSSRHRYLNIEPSEDLGAYYALSSASAPAVEVLEDIGAYHQAEDGFDSIVGRTGYAAECGYGVDGAAEVKSFVQLRFEGREVFVVLIWEQGEWKYTDVRRGPLLEGLSSTPTLTINSFSSGEKTKAMAKATQVVTQTQSANDLAEGDDSGDDYWARYGANSDSEDEESGVPRTGLPPSQTKGKGKRKANSSGTRSVGEDAYWAQYGTGSVTASPGIGHGITLMPVQQQYDSAMDGEGDRHRELRTSIQQALTRTPTQPHPGAPKARILSLDLITPILSSSPSSSNHQAQADRLHNHSIPYPHLHTPSIRHEMRDQTTDETLTLHRAPLQPTSGIPQGLALDLNTPPPTQPTLGITTMLPTIGSPASTVTPAFAAASRSGSITGMSPLLVGIGSPVVGSVERGLTSGAATHATGGGVAEPVHAPANLLDILMRERRGNVIANCVNRLDGKSTRARAGDATHFEADEAVLQSLRGVFRMWHMLRGTTRGSSTPGDNNDNDTEWDVESVNKVEEKREFLSLVERALADL